MSFPKSVSEHGMKPKIGNCTGIYNQQGWLQAF